VQRVGVILGAFALLTVTVACTSLPGEFHFSGEQKLDATIFYNGEPIRPVRGAAGWGSRLGLRSPGLPKLRRRRSADRGATLPLCCVGHWCVWSRRLPSSALLRRA
jgi:hypothetical protein